MSNIEFPSFPDGFKDSPFGKIFKDDPPATSVRRQRTDRFFDRDPAPTKDKKALSFRRKVLFFQPATDSQSRIALLLRLPDMGNLDGIADIRSRIVLTNSQTMEPCKTPIIL